MRTFYSIVLFAGNISNEIKQHVLCVKCTALSARHFNLPEKQ